MNYAVIKTGGKQYRVNSGSKLEIEKIEASVGENITFDTVIMVKKDEEDAVFGTPYVASATVSAAVIGQIRDPKVKILKFKRRKHHMKQMGHRQYKTQIQITAISA